MTSTFPNDPLWPRFGRSGSRPAAIASSSVTAPGTAVATDEPETSSRRPNPTGRSVIVVAPAVVAGQPAGLVVERVQALDPGQQSPLAVVEPLVDVDREDEATAGRPDAERDRNCVISLVGDRDGDPRHPELPRPPFRAAVEADCRLSRRQPLDLDLLPADAPHAQPEDLADGLLRGPAAGERLGPIADVAALRRRQDTLREARS